MPYNPDDLMVQCESCKDWFHSYCVDLTPEQVTNMDKYMCSSCAPENHKRASAPSHKTPDIKVMMCKILVVLCTHSATYTRSMCFDSCSQVEGKNKSLNSQTKLCRNDLGK
jgi:hypothetical protein